VQGPAYAHGLLSDDLVLDQSGVDRKTRVHRGVHVLSGDPAGLLSTSTSATTAAQADPPIFTFALAESDGDLYGPIALATRDWHEGELVPPGTMRVVAVLEPERDGHLPLLVVERVWSRFPVGEPPGTNPRLVCVVPVCSDCRAA
jgi:hypothetical protein